MKREFLDYVEDIVDAMNHAISFVKGLKFESFAKDTKTVFAVVRALEIVGEASRRIPDEVKQRYPGIPWKDMAGMRDKLIHGYFGVKLDVVWDTVKKEIPSLLPMFKEIIGDSKK
jgi:uncharacterized protein with HEPN domain